MSEVYSEPSQRGFFGNSKQLLVSNYFHKLYILDVWQGSE